MIREHMIKLYAKYIAIPFAGNKIYIKALEKHNLSIDDGVELYKKVFNTDNRKTTISLENIGKVYENGFKAIHNLSLEIKPQEFVSLLGPSGCGKTTILRMIAGLETISEGKFKIDDILMNSSLPKERSLAMVFQNYALYPYMTVYENIAFGLKIAAYDNKVSNEFLDAALSAYNPHHLDIKYNKARIYKLKHSKIDEIRELKAKLRKEKKIKSGKVDITKLKDLLNETKKLQATDYESAKTEILELKQHSKKLKKDKSKSSTEKRELFESMIASYIESVVIFKKTIPARIDLFSELVGIKPYLRRKPSALSGGQRQRVALVRAISKDASTFLFDEPLSNLDAKLRSSMRTEIRSLHDKMKATSIFVTHDQVEAMTMSDKIVLMNKGYIQQVGTPQELFNNPSNIFVADFIGSPRTNFVNATLISETQLQLATGSKIRIAAPTDLVKKKMTPYLGKEIIVSIRPQNIITDSVLIGEAKENVFKVNVKSIENIGHENIIITSSKEFGDNFKVVTGRYIFVKPGDVMEILLNRNTMQVFESENGISISSVFNKETEDAQRIWLESANERIKNQILSVKEQTKQKLSHKIVKSAYYAIDTKRGTKVKASQDALMKKAIEDKTLIEIVEDQGGN